MQAIIFKSTGSFYLAIDEEGNQWNCRIRGRLKIDNAISSTNPVAVGDYVILQLEDEQNRTAVIKDILPRENYMVRSAPQNRHQKHIVAANIQQAVLVATLHSPRTSLGFIDRFLVTAEMYHIPAIIVVNKIDLWSRDSFEIWEEISCLYSNAGYFTLPVSAMTGVGIPKLKKYLQGKKTLFSGHSGVGKSTLINHLKPDLQLRTGVISDWSGKGKHTTTFAEMFALDNSTYIIDTPGIKEFGLIDTSLSELSHYFPEMRPFLNNCKFNNCMHLNEPHCAIKKAIKEEILPIERYASYLSMLENIQNS